MNILHIGWGFVPWRAGGLISYAHDLMDYQAEQGWQVSYFCAGRHYPLARRTFMKHWHRKDVEIFEIVNSPIVHAGDRGTFEPQYDLQEPVSEQLFIEVLQKVSPDIIHIHELAGLPSSLIEIAKEQFGLPVLMTLADYFLLCPTLKLFDIFGQNCRYHEVANRCIKCCFGAPKSKTGLVLQTLFYRVKPLAKKAPRSWLAFIGSRLQPSNAVGSETGVGSELYGQRRELNLVRLRKVDLLVARSHRVAEIYQFFLGEGTSVEVLNPTLRHIDNIKPHRQKGVGLPLRLVTLNGFSSVAKGAELLLETVEILERNGAAGRFKLFAYGALDSKLRSRVMKLDSIDYRGPYRTNELDSLLEGMNVGIVPSVWEEVFGYVGPEMLAKGLPIIGNRTGGISEYTQEDRTGWLNNNCSSEELASIINKLIENPDLVIAMNDNIIRESPVKSYNHHFSRIEALYLETINKVNSRIKKL